MREEVVVQIETTLMETQVMIITFSNKSNRPLNIQEDRQL